MTSFIDKVAKAQSRVKGHEISIKFTRSKFEEIMKKLNAEEEAEENNSESESSSFDEVHDLKEQAKMLKKIVEEQNEKQALEMQKLEEEKERAQHDKNKHNKEQELIEILLTEEELRKMRDSFSKFGIEFPTPAQIAIQNIIKDGPNRQGQHNHSVSNSISGSEGRSR